jgi:hypothetical protein
MKAATWIRRAGIALIAAYVVSNSLAVVVRTVIFGRSDSVLRAYLLSSALVWTGMLVGVGLLVIGLAIGAFRWRPGSPSAAVKKLEIALSVVLVASGSVYAVRSIDGQGGKAVYHATGPRGVVKPYNTLFPGRSSAEPGDIEARLNQPVQLGDLAVRVTQTRLVHPTGEFNMWNDGWYLVVFYTVTNYATTAQSFSDIGEWEFDLPDHGVTFVDPTGGPLHSNSMDETVPPRGTLQGRISVNLGATRDAIPLGHYYVLWSPTPCEVSRVNFAPLHDCRGVWLADPPTT